MADGRQSVLRRIENAFLIFVFKLANMNLNTFRSLCAKYAAAIRKRKHSPSFIPKLLLSYLLFFFVSVASGQQKKARSIIFDSDMGPDYDDVGAIAMLHALADSGQAKILATIASTKYDGVAGVFDALNTYFNRPDMPIAVPKGEALTLKDWQHWSDTILARYPHNIKATMTCLMLLHYTGSCWLHSGIKALPSLPLAFSPTLLIY
jgi:hypothetical protein